MNVKEYISSGIVESYVMGLVTDAEQQEFETNCAQYPEVAEARNAFELALEDQLLLDAKQPPSFLQKQIEDKLNTSISETNNDEQEEERTPVRRMGVWKWMAAASLILLAGSGYLFYTTNNKYQVLVSENKNLKDQLNNSTVQLNNLMEDKETLQHPMKVASLKGTGIAPQAFATVYWDTASTKNVYLMINNLPEPASGKQYQLWALLDGKPIDLGVFDMDIRQTHLLVKMQNVQRAQAFAITLEPKGGSQNPTMNSMYVMGSL